MELSLLHCRLQHRLGRSLEEYRLLCNRSCLQRVISSDRASLL